MTSLERYYFQPITDRFKRSFCLSQLDFYGQWYKRHATYLEDVQGWEASTKRFMARGDRLRGRRKPSKRRGSSRFSLIQGAANFIGPGRRILKYATEDVRGERGLWEKLFGVSARKSVYRR